MIKTILPPATFLTYSLGCRTNQAEMEKIALQLVDCGFEQTTGDISPDIVLLNTCVVTQKAEKETKQTIRQLKKKYPKAFLVVLGCGVDAKEKLKVDLPEVDLLISNEEKENASIIILKHFEQQLSKGLSLYKDSPLTKDDTQNKYISSGRKFIKIQDGCSNRCSFCVTCLLRGLPKSKTEKEIIEEINYWVERGVNEIILTGINISLWGNPPSSHQMLDYGRARDQGSGSSKQSIENLVETILLKTDIKRLTFSSIYPEILTDDFINLVVNNPRISQFFHLSLQSCSPTVLQRMNRKTDLEKLFSQMNKIKKLNPLFIFRADFIVGFPNETDGELNETLDFVKKSNISFAHIFSFSPRKGTVAYENINNKAWKDLPMKTKKERQKMLTDEINKNRVIMGEKMIRETIRCLILRKLQCHSRLDRESIQINTNEQIKGNNEQSRNNFIDSSLRWNDINAYEGITENGWNIKIKIKNQKSKIKTLKGKILPVKIIGFENDYLIGEIIFFPTKGLNTFGISTLPSAF